MQTCWSVSALINNHMKFAIFTWLVGSPAKEAPEVGPASDVLAYIPHNQKARAKLISRMLSLIRLKLIETHTHTHIYIYIYIEYTYIHILKNTTGFGILMS